MLKTTAILLLLALLNSGGCYTDPKTTMGRSYRQAIIAQTLNPAPPTQEPVVGFEGTAAKGTMDSYAAGFTPENSIDMNAFLETMMEDK